MQHKCCMQHLCCIGGVAQENFMKNIRLLYYNAATSTAVAVSGVFYGAGEPEHPANKKPLILFRTRGLGGTRLLWIMFWWRQRPLN